MKKIISTLFILVLITSFAFAGFGISFPSKIPLLPGETYEGNLNLQNVLEPTTDTTFEITIEQGQEYVEFPNGNQIQINAGDVANIPIKVTAPEKTNLDSIKIILLIEPILDQSSQGAINLVVGLKKSFDIEIIKPVGLQTFAIIALILLAIIAGILIWFVIRTIKMKN
jgi:hypothetical protein